MAICKQKTDFEISADALLQLAKREQRPFVIAIIHPMIHACNTNSPTEEIYILPQVWKKLVRYIRGSDVCYVNNGNFYITISDASTEEIVTTFCERMFELLKGTYHYNHKQYDVNLCIGISLYPKDSDMVNEMIEHANKALGSIIKEKPKSNLIAYY